MCLQEGTITPLSLPPGTIYFNGFGAGVRGGNRTSGKKVFMQNVKRFKLSVNVASKTNSKHLLRPLEHLVNLSFDSGTFPSSLKIAKVTQILKKGDPFPYKTTALS